MLSFLLEWCTQGNKTAQSALQSKDLSVDQTAIKMGAFRHYIEENPVHILEEAIDLATKKSEDSYIPKEKRVCRKKRIAGELGGGAGLRWKDELEKDMLKCLD